MTSPAKILLPILVLLLGAGSASLFVYFKRQTEPNPIVIVPPLVRVIEATPETVNLKAYSQGTVLPKREILLVPEVGGRVIQTSRSLAAGGFFAENEVLIRIDPRDYELACTNAAAQVRQAELRLSQEKAEAELALKEWEDLNQSDSPPSPLLLRKPQLAQAEAGLAAAQAALSQAELQLERTEIRAPFPGRVWEKRVDIGQFVAPGSNLGRIYAVDVAEIRLPVSLTDLGYLDIPENYRLQEMETVPSVILTARAGTRDLSWTGQIVRIEGEIDRQSRMATVVAEVIDPYNRSATRTNSAPLAVGLFVEAELIGRRISDAFILPRTALRGSDQVVTVTASNTLKFKTVSVLQSNRKEVLINEGLIAGDQVSISLLEGPQDGMEVRLNDDPAPLSTNRPPTQVSNE